MTPKEKAQELYDKMYDYSLFEEEAKRCALIAVDEIISNWRAEATIQYPYGRVINYWNVVKEEIIKL